MKNKVIEARIVVQRGDDYWAEMLKKADGFTVAEVARASGAEKAAVRNFANRLVKGGLATKTGVRGCLDVYTLLHLSPVKPRLDADGKLIQETVYETVWRSMRMAKDFSITSLMDYLGARVGGASESTVRYYIRDLLAVGIVAPTDRKARTFRLVRNLGTRAPRILSTNIVFDPNSGTAVGEATVHEVQS
jgi:predicted transcriptional regulator of viral defense system